ncbi:MAG: 2-oxoacid:acceptor oxidoreductase family protein [Sulfuritalea sp.]|nr:2-oxoacid:acceptor oxidoreductase family protein [Sulfuritalea sp.]
MKCQTVIAGIGGQGVLFAAKVLTETARRRKLQVLGSQTFGMAQRGGSVMTHLKIGPFESPLVCEGDADLLLALDSVEAHRTLPYLHARRNGHAALCVVNAAHAQGFLDPRLAELVAEMGIVVHACNADAVALELKQPLVANLVLLGYGASRQDFPFGYEELWQSTAALSADAHRDTNLAALERGRAL